MGTAMQSFSWPSGTKDSRCTPYAATMTSNPAVELCRIFNNNNCCISEISSLSE